MFELRKLLFRVLCILSAIALLAATAFAAQEKDKPVSDQETDERNFEEATSYEIKKLVERYEQKGDYDKAVQLLQKVIAVKERKFGPYSPEFVARLGDLARIYQKALSVYEKALGSEHPNVLSILQSLAGAYLTIDPKKAEPIYFRILSIHEKKLDSDDLSAEASQRALKSYVSTIQVLTYCFYLIYKDKTLEDEKERLFKSALAAVEKRAPGGLDHFRYLMESVKLNFKRGDLGEAERLYQKALAISEKTPGSDDDKIHRILNSCFVDLNSLPREVAEQFFDKAVSILERRFLQKIPSQPNPGSELIETFKSWQYYTARYFRKEEVKRTQQIYQRVLSSFEKRLGPEHPDVLAILIELAQFQRRIDEQEISDQYYQRASAIVEKSTDFDDLIALRKLTLESIFQNRYDKAEAFQRRVLTIYERKFGREDPEIAAALFLRALLSELNGDSAEAEKLYDRYTSILEKAADRYIANTPRSASDAVWFGNRDNFSLRLVNSNTPLSAFDVVWSAVQGSFSFHSALFQKKRSATSEKALQKALAVFDRIRVADPARVNSFLLDIAEIHFKRGDVDAAVKCQARINEALEFALTRRLIIGSEREKKYYFNSSFYFDLSLSLNLLSAPDNLEARRTALEAILQRKGRSLDVMADNIAILRRIESDEDKKLLDELSQAKSGLSAFTLNNAEARNSEEYRRKRSAIEDRIDELETMIGRRSAEFRARLQPITLDAVQKAVPKGAALVEFAVYRPSYLHRARFRGDGIIENMEEFKKSAPARYAAYLLGDAGEPTSVDLGEAEPINKAVAALRSALRDGNSDVERDVKPKAKALYDLVMKPVLRLAGDMRRLLVSPDGPLNLVPFEALTDEEGRFLVERFEISYLTSGRDLLRPQSHVESKPQSLIIADPDFESGPGPKLNEHAFEPLKRLKSSAEEAAQIKAKLGDATMFLQEKATKSALKELSRPRILHIATHGFFLEDEKRETAEADLQRIAVRRIAGEELNEDAAEAKRENPLLRSGLFLSGANAKGEDGVLTALEVAGLNLSGTKLVVLSACDTGVGDVKNGDGVYGLRRALVLAGSESQLMSLWSVSDKGTKDLMVSYYEKLKAGEGRSAGLRKTRLEMLANPARRHPYYWASFIQSGEWDSLESKRLTPVFNNAEKQAPKDAKRREEVLSKIAAYGGVDEETEFKEFASESGKFSILMPGLPKEEKRPFESPIAKGELTTFTAKAGRASYVAAYADFEHIGQNLASNKEIFVFKFSDGFIAAAKGFLQASIRTSINKHPGRSLCFHTRDQVAYGRFYMVQDRLYQMVVFAERGKDLDDAEKIARFLNSFKIIDKNSKALIDENLLSNFDPALPQRPQTSQTADSEKEGDVLRAGKDGVKSPQIIKKTKPSYTGDARKNQVEGQVTISAVFRKDGTISDVKVLRRLGYGLDEESIKAASKIEFVPGQRDGQSVNVRARLEFTFSLLH